MLSRGIPRLKSDTLAQSIVVAIALAIVCRAVALGRGVVLVRTLEPADLGTWALMVNAVQVLAFFAALGIPSGISRYAERHRLAGSLPSFFQATLRRSFLLALVLCGLGTLLWRPLGHALYAETSGFSLVAITAAAILVTVLLSVLQGMLHGLRLFRVNALVELLYNLGFLMLAMVLLCGWRSDLMTAALAYLAATTLAAWFLGAWVFRRVRASGAETKQNEGSAQARLPWWPLVLFSLGTWSAGSLQAIWRCLDRYMLLHLGTLPQEEALDQIGQYFIASKLAQPLSALIGVLSIVLLPHSARLWERGQRCEVGDLIRLVAKLATLGMISGGALLILCKPLLLKLLAGYLPPLAGAMFAPVVVAIVAVSFHYVVRAYLLCDERAWLLSGIWVTALAVNVLGNAILIPRYAILGAAVATMLSALLAATLLLVLCARRGLRTDRGLWLLLVAPTVLLLPGAGMLAAVALLLAITLGTGQILTSAEKQAIDRWCREKLLALRAAYRRLSNRLDACT